MADLAQAARGQSFATAVHRTYDLTYDVTLFDVSAGGNAYIYLGTTEGANDVLSHEILSTGSKATTFVATSVITYLTGVFIRDGYANDFVKLDNVSVIGEIVTITQDGGLAQLIKWEAENLEVMRLWLRDLAFLRDPYQTPYLDELEREFGIKVDESISAEDRMGNLAAVAYQRPGNGADTSLQSALDRAFPDRFTVYQNEPPQDPGSLDGGSTGGRLIVNGRIYLFGFDWFVGAGEARAQCGDSITGPPAFYAQAGEYLSVINTEIVYEVPASPDYWHLIFFVGAEDTTANLALDGNMEKPGLADWSVAGAGAVVTKETADPYSGLRYVRIVRGTAVPYIFQIILTVGVRYKVTGRARSNGVGDTKPAVGTGLTHFWTGTNSTSWQEIDFLFISDETGFLLYNSTFVDGEYCEFNNIEIAEYLVADGNMEEVGVADWTASGGASLSKETDNPAEQTQWLKVFNTLSPGSAFQAALMVTGDKYSLRAYAKSDGFSPPRIYDGGADIWIGTLSTEWQTVSVDFTASHPTLFLGKDSVNTGFVGFDDVWLRPNEPFGDVAIDGDMEASGTSAWTAGNSATLSKISTDPYRGEEVLRVAYNGVANPFASQDVLIIGEWYRIVGYARGDGTAFPRLLQNGIIWTGTTSTDWQRMDFSFIAVAVDTYALQSSASAAGYCEFDDVRVWKIRQSIDRVDIPIQRRADFERAILKIKPLHSWCMAFVGYDLVLNGGFDDDSEWTLGSNWTIADGKASKTASGGARSISQSGRGVVVDKSYEVTFAISNYVAGTITPSVGDTGVGTARSADGQYQEVIVAAGSDDIIFLEGSAAFDGSIDNVVCIELGD